MTGRWADWDWQQVWVTDWKIQRRWLRERWKYKIPKHTGSIRDPTKTPGSWHKPSFLLLISGCGRGSAGWTSGEGGNWSLFSSCEDKAHLGPYQTSSGQPLGLPLQCHTKSNRKTLPVLHCFRKPHAANDVFYWCVNLKVIPAKSNEKIQVSFAPLTPSASEGRAKCAGFALGFMSLDSEVTCSVNKTLCFSAKLWRRGEKSLIWLMALLHRVHGRRLFVSQVKSEESTVWIWSPSDWIYKLSLTMSCK